MEYRDYYQILELDRNSTNEEIRQAYRKLAMQYHPDRNPNDSRAEEKFRQITEAFQVLGDPEKRLRYDRLTVSYTAWSKSDKKENFEWDKWFDTAKTSQATQAYRSNAPEKANSGFSDFFRQIFSKPKSETVEMPTKTVAKENGTSVKKPSGNKKRTRRGYDHPVRISLEEAYRGTERTVQVEGRLIKSKIPIGAKSGTKVRIAGIGPVGPDGKRMDIYLLVHVDSDDVFERKDNDLYTNVSVDLYTAVLGGQVSVPHFDGHVILTIPSGTQPGQTFRLTGKGMPVLQNATDRGNLMVRVKVNIPRDLSTQQQDLFLKLRQISSEKKNK